jgi:hypothetical protein
LTVFSILYVLILSFVQYIKQNNLHMGMAKTIGLIKSGNLTLTEKGYPVIERSQDALLT